MKKNKLLVIPMLLIITGCGKNIDEDKQERYIQDYGNTYYTIIDKESCVEYIKFSSYNQAGLSPRFNPDGTLKLNKECVRDNANNENN